MKEGDVVLTPIPQADGAIKKRPAIVMREMPPYKVFPVCGVSTQMHQQVSGFDDTILTSDADFPVSGLKSESVIRLGFLAVLPSRNIVGSIGSISPERHKRLLKTLSDFLVQ